MSKRVAAALASSHLAAAFLLAGALPAAVAADSLKPADLARVRAATFEVVMMKPETDSLTYERPLPLDLLPYSERTDKYISIGTAFSIGANRYVTASHVLQRGFLSQYGEPALRGSDGVVHAIESVHQYSSSQDFAVVSLQDKVSAPPLPVNRKPALNQTVYAVGNALGEGIVIRDGLFTSQTPEERHGEWKWIRFSAAASPGNSGGPLMDTNGRVIGVVLRKSENENLNYAVPIELVLDAPANIAKVKYELVANVPIMDTTESGENEIDVPLPRGVRDLGRELADKGYDYYVGLQNELMRKQADVTFPKGAGSQALLYRTPRLNALGLLYRGEDGNWDVVWPQRPETSQLDRNGFLSYGNVMNVSFVKFRRPDDMAVSAFYEDSKYYADTLIKAWGWKRNVGREQVKITSLGKAKRESRFVDTHGRIWQVRTWDVEYDDSVMISLSLPVPDGYLALVHYTPTDAVRSAIHDLEMMASFSYPSYTGTLQQWQEYLARKDLLPPAIEACRIESDLQNNFKFAAQRFEVSVSSKVQKILPESLLALSVGYLPGADSSAAWDVAGMVLGEKLGSGQALVVGRTLRPPATLPQAFTLDWQKVVDRTFPYNAVATDVGGVSMIGAVYPHPAPKKAPLADSQFLYALSVIRQGKQSQSDMDGALAALSRGLVVKEK